MELFSNNLDEAQRAFEYVIERQPAYLDAQQGLQRIAKFRKAGLGL